MKNSTTVLVALLSILAILVLGFMVFLLLVGDNFNFSWGGKSTLLLEKTYQEKISQLEIDAVSSDVYVKEAEDNQIRVVIYGNEKEEAQSTLENETLSVKKTGNHFCFGFCFSKKEIIIYLPKDSEIKINAKTVSGDIEIGTFKNSNIEAKTTSGDIKVGNATSVKLKSTSGDIHLDKGDFVETQTTSGDIKLYQVLKNINAKSVSGDINIENLEIESDSYIHTTSGDVTIHNKNDFYIETSTLSGDVNIENNNRYANPTLKIETTSGDIRVK